MTRMNHHLIGYDDPSFGSSSSSSQLQVSYSKILSSQIYCAEPRLLAMLGGGGARNRDVGFDMTAVRPLKGKYDDNVESKDTLQSLVQSCCCGGARKYLFQSPLDDVQECKHHHHLPEQKEPIFDQNVRNLRDYYLMSLKKSSSNSISLSHVSSGVSKEAMHVKTRIRWTEDLHKKFMECVDRLGGPKKATPKAILKLMNCNGLTIFHIKSHLQKHRLARLTQDESEGNAEQLNAKTGMQIVEALRLQMDVQRHLFEQLESQKKLQLRIEEQGKQLQTMLQCQMNTK